MSRPTAINLTYYFYPIGNTPAVCLTQDLPSEDDAQILLLGCGDIRNVLFTAYADAAPTTRRLDITCCDTEGAIIARNILTFTLMLDDVDGEDHSSIWQIYYHMYLDDKSHKLLRAQGTKLSQLAQTLETWKAGPYGKILIFCDEGTLKNAKLIWGEYSTSGLSDSEKADQETRIGASFELARQMKIEHVGTKLALSGLRSAAPASYYAMQDTTKIHNHYWEHGTTDPSPSKQPEHRRPNPTYAPSEGDTFTLHYGSDPQLGFPLATAYVPLTKESPLHTEGTTRSDIHKISDAARTHFQAWVKSFQRSAENFTLRFFIGDAIAFCHTLQHVISSGNVESNWYRSKYTSQKINLFAEDYNSPASSPITFNAIDTSNLVDHLGPLNVLVAAAPLLRRGLASTMYTESLVAREKDRGDYLDRLLCGSFRTMSLLLGLVPIDYWTNAMAASTEAESMLNRVSAKIDGVDENQASQLRCRIVWKTMLPSSTTKEAPERMLNFDPEELAVLLHHTYQAMFENEKTKGFSSLSIRIKQNMSCPLYNRGSFAAFVRFVKTRVVTEWDESMDILLDKIERDTSIKLGGAYYYDLSAHFSTLNIYDTPTYLAGDQPSDAARSQTGLGKWKSMPEVVCITLEVPRSVLKVIIDIQRNQLGMPNVHCTVESGDLKTNRQDMFADVRLTFGDLSTVGEPFDDDHRVIIQEDPLGWNGKGSLLVSFNVPSWIVLQDPAETNVTFGLQYTLRSWMTFAEILDKKMTLYTAKLSDDNRVHITKFSPHQTGFASVSTFNPNFDNKDLTEDVKIAIHANIDINQTPASISGFEGHLEFHDEKLKAVVQAGSRVSLTQLSYTTISITLENHTPNLTVTFPVPVRFIRSRTRVAREASYIEVPVLFADHIFNLGFLNFMYPLSLRNNIPIVSNMPYLNLTCLPIIDITRKINITGKSLEWLSSHAALQLSPHEGKQKQLSINSPNETADARTDFKNSIHAMFTHISASKDKKRSVFGLVDVGRTTPRILVVVSRLLLDVANHTVVLDCAIIPITHENKRELLPIFQAIHDTTAGKVYGIQADKAEMQIWREVMPALVERCRTWQHLPDCAYGVSGKIPLSSDKDEVPVICSCGEGNFPDGFVTEVVKPLWAIVRKYATRAAISPTFPVDYVERPVTI